MNTQTTPTENTVPQWAKDAATEHVQATINTFRTAAGLIDSLAQIIAKHAPQHWSVGEMASQIQQRDAMRQERDAARAELETAKKQLALAYEPKPSIWRPVSQRPTREDGAERETVVRTFNGEFWEAHWDDVQTTSSGHWTRTADLLALAPLPKEKTQEQKDAEYITEIMQAFQELGPSELRDAIEYGRKHPTP